MIALGNRRLWLCGEPVDMRKGIDGLVAVTGHNPRCAACHSARLFRLW
jgi:hypothetical protein